jgi:Ca2+:H+ antiporter
MEQPLGEHAGISGRIHAWALKAAHALRFKPSSIRKRRDAAIVLHPVAQNGDVDGARIENGTKLASRRDPGSRLSEARGNPQVDGDGGAAAAAPSLPTASPLPPDGVSDTAGQHKGRLQKILKRFLLAIKRILLSSWINTLLVFVPAGIVVHHVHVSATTVFAINAVAIVPLAALLSYATESVAIKMGDTVGALMNVTFGNAVELIIL